MNNPCKGRPGVFSSSETGFIRAVVIYIAVSLFLVFEMAVQVSPSVMAQDLMSGLNFGVVSLGFMSSAYFYTYTAMQIPSGALFDRGHPRVIIVSAALACSIGALFFGYAGGFYQACIARMLMGAGSAFAFVSVLVMASRLFNPKWFSLLVGVTQMLAALGAMFGQMTVSLLEHRFHWRHTMVLLGVMGLVLSLILLIVLSGQKSQASQDRLAVRKSQSKRMPLALFSIVSKPSTWFLAIYALLLWAPMSGFASLWGVPFLENMDALSHGDAAFYCSLMWLGLALGSPVFGFWLSISKNKVVPLIVSSCIGMTAFACVLLCPLHGLLLGLCLFLSGTACAGQALSFAIVKDNNADSVRGMAIAFNNMAVVISGAIFQPLIGGLLHVFQSSLTMQYTLALSVIELAYVLSCVVACVYLWVSQAAPSTTVSHQT